MDVPAPPAALVERGRTLYLANCARCHGFAGEPTAFPDLRRLTPETYEAFDEIVLQGLFRSGGMASFADVLGPEDTRAIRAYLADWAARSRRAEQDRAKPVDAGHAVRAGAAIRAVN
jgi:quinohemoprotein ethanol dehydrogenase